MKETDIKELNEKIKQESAFVEMLSIEMHKVIVGQKHMLESMLIGYYPMGIYY